MIILMNELERQRAIANQHMAEAARERDEQAEEIL